MEAKLDISTMVDNLDNASIYLLISTHTYQTTQHTHHNYTHPAIHYHNEVYVDRNNLTFVQENIHTPMRPYIKENIAI
jgi:hypothetical protein